MVELEVSYIRTVKEDMQVALLQLHSTERGWIRVARSALGGGHHMRRRVFAYPESARFNGRDNDNGGAYNES